MPSCPAWITIDKGLPSSHQVVVSPTGGRLSTSHLSSRPWSDIAIFPIMLHFNQVRNKAKD
jgi:hypothetical protein